MRISTAQGLALMRCSDRIALCCSAANFSVFQKLTSEAEHIFSKTGTVDREKPYIFSNY